MRLNDLRDNAGARRPAKRIGRGIGSGKGKTSGKGVKGQKARSGVSLLGFEGGQMPLHRRLPKRGFKNPFALDVAELTTGKLQKALDKGTLDAKQPITTAVLVSAGVARKTANGVKLINNGELTAKVSLEISYASKGALAAVEAAGGSVTLPAPKERPAGKGRRRDRISAERKAKFAAARAGGEIEETTEED